MQDGSLSPVGKFFHSKWVWLIGAIDIVIIIVVIIAVIINARKTNVIDFNVVPSDAQISVNGDTSFANGQYRLPPGEYAVEISHPGLASKTFLVDLEHQDMASITTFLSDDGNFDYYRLRDHFGDFTALSQIASAGYNQTTDGDTSAEAFINNYEEQYSLYSTELPIEYKKSEGFGRELQILADITIRADNSCNITLCVEALMVGTDSKDLVKALMQEKGFNLEDYEINYTTF